MILTMLDLCGTFIFALEAVRHRLDWLGVLVLSAISGVGGDILGDVILGSTPPAAFGDEKYLFTALAAGVLVIIFIPLIPEKVSSPIGRIIPLGDALGLGVFTLIGAAKGYEAGLGPAGVIFTGAVTSCGG